MRNPLTIAWATQVDPSQLGARLEAYAETKSAIEAFKSLELGLPAEIIEIITNEVKDSAYMKKIGLWLKAQSCYERNCEPPSHFSAQELHDKFSIGCDVHDEVWDEFDGLYGDSDERHTNAVDLHLAKINPTASAEGRGNSGILSVSQQEFTNDFGIHPYFTVLESCELDHGEVNFESANVSAFLMLPVTEISLKAQSGWNTSNFVVEQTLSIPDFGDCTTVAQRFKGAVKALRLNTGHVHGTSERHQNVCKCEPDSEKDDDSDGPLHLSDLKDDDKNESKAGLDEHCVSADVHNITGDSPSAKRRAEECDEWSDDGSEDSEGELPYGVFCFDCNSTNCHGMVQQIKDPALMILGSGILETITCFD